MKRFLVIVLAFLLVIGTGYYFYYGKGYYFNFEKSSEIASPFQVKNDTIYRTVKGKSEPFEIKGVEMDSSYGSKRGTDFSVDEETWKRWFGEIQKMGANTIRVSTVLDAKFYNAFHAYNKSRQEPLYLLQGMRVATDEWETKKEAADLPFYKTLKKDGRDLVDIIHGRKLILTNDHKGSGFYRCDVSPWVLGFLIGDYWDQDMVAYVDNTLNSKESFDGDYVAVGEEGTAFEAMMADIIEHIVSYESGKYASQHLISVNSSFSMDPFQYEEHYALQLGKYNAFSMDHIKPTKRMESGLFTSYAYEDETLPTLEMLQEEERKTFAGTSSYYELLRQAHEGPVIISSFGYPSATYLNHAKEQKTEILSGLKKFEENGLNGAIIRSWQDVWNRRMPETSYAVDLQQINEWHDPLTRTQHFGLIGFKPYRDDHILMNVDGKNDDWKGVKAVFEKAGTKLAMTRDHAYMYIWIEEPGINEKDPFYLALDTQPELGSRTPDTVNQTFDRNMDFLIEIEPDKGAKVYVQDRYQSVRENFLEQTSGENPFVQYPKKNSHHFEAVQHLEKDKKILTKAQLEASKKMYNYSFEDVHLLRMAGNEKVEDADVAIDKGHIEMRIPYQLLNVHDPLKFTIHDDYYEHFGVKPLKVDEFYMSFFSHHSKPSKSVKVPVEPLEPSVRVKEYVKPSYDSVKFYWKGEDQDVTHTD